MTEPTDDELDAVIAEYRTRIYPQDMHPRFERAIMRAAIAKWGTPPAVEGDRTVSHKAQSIPGVQWQCGPQASGFTVPQADSVTAPAGGANWQDISTAPKDGTRFVAVGNNYGLYSEGQHTCIAQWFRGCWMDVSEWNETSELKYLTHWMPLPPLPGNAARKQGASHDKT